ncbi:transmembrane protein 192 isoform X2 [Amia ocellicauda]|uniref:transmembrane protein 192 isoform X2 n=1 Tax=Amia ocellicauda TaxID=2972642 RepID=UPI0034648BEF
MDSDGSTIKANNSGLDITQSLEEDALVDGPLISPDALDSDIKPEFQKLPTCWFALILLLVNVAFVGLSSALAVFCSIKQDNADECKRYIHDFESKTVIVFAKVALWLLHVLFEHVVQRQHSRWRSRGYLHFYRSTRNVKRLPLFVQSVGNAALLLVLSARLSLPGDRHLYMYLLLGVLGLELCFSAPVLLFYAVTASDRRAGEECGFLSTAKRFHRPRRGRIQTRSPLKSGIYSNHDPPCSREFPSLPRSAGVV